MASFLMTADRYVAMWKKETKLSPCRLATKWGYPIEAAWRALLRSGETKKGLVRLCESRGCDRGCRVILKKIPNIKSRRRTTASDVSLITELYKSGKTADEVARLTGWSSNTVLKKVRPIVRSVSQAKRKVSIEEVELMKHLYLKGMTAEEVGEEIGYFWRTVVRYIKEIIRPVAQRNTMPERLARVEAKIRLFSREEALRLRERYEQDESTVQLAREFSCTPGCIAQNIQRVGGKIRSSLEVQLVRPQQYTLNPEVFINVIDELPSYLLGTLLTDGCVMERGESKRKALSLAMVGTSQGQTVVELLKKYLQTDAPVHIFTPRQESYQTVYSLDVYNTELVNSLEKYGIVPRKSRTAQANREWLSSLSENSKCEFFRGCVEGDGWLSVQQRKNRTIPIIGLCGSKELCEQFRAFAHERIESKVTVRAMRSIYSVSFTGYRACEFIRRLYGHSPTYGLPYKMEMAKNILSWWYRGKGPLLDLVPENRRGEIPEERRLARLAKKTKTK